VNIRNRLALAALSIFLLLPPPCFSTDVEVAFSPDRGATALVVRTIDSAKTSIRVAAYSFTSKPIAEALLDAHRRGIDVEVVVDKSNVTARYTAATFLANQGVPVRVDYRYAIMHDKFIIVDGEAVETGSFNFTQSASDSQCRECPGAARSRRRSQVRAGMEQALGGVGGDESSLLIFAISSPHAVQSCGGPQSMRGDGGTAGR
jgi:hypothetical protein